MAVSIIFVILLCLTGQSFGQDKYHGHLHSHPQLARAQDTIKLEAFFERLLQQAALADTEEHNSWSTLDREEEEEVEEEADSLSSIVRYVGTGYNLLKGSPDGDFDRGGADPGILQEIIEFTYKENKDADFRDTTVKVPDQVEFRPISTCAAQSKANVYSGSKSYQKSLNYGINVEASVFGFQFGLSGAIKKANEETAGRKRVIMDQKKICNYGHVRYLTDATGIRKLKKPFYNRVKNLPKEYNIHDYMQFLRDWGTHVIVEADVGTKYINKSSFTYKQIYQKLEKEKSGGIKVGGAYQGQGGSISLDISKIKTSGRNSSSYGSQVIAFTIGTMKKPYPIYLTLNNISELLRPEYWSSWRNYKKLGIAQKMRNLQRAFEGYADYEGVHELKDPKVQINSTWPDGQYSLPAPIDDCPKKWNRGIRVQSTGENIRYSRGITKRLKVDFRTHDKYITSYYCTKENTDDDPGIGFEWPEGSYCIARKGNFCPYPENAFKEGSITWNDYKSFLSRKNSNLKWGHLPDGVYDKNTEIEFCCRNDGAASEPILLPISNPFVLYRYGGKCQAVQGTTVREDFIKYGSNNRAFSKNRCTGEHPDDDNCKAHALHFCYYHRK